ncbi:MAG: AMP-binding protein, partial [Rhodospirillales bacterium]|nr:AMP-binding protein [Rhodospirillales bacterium]
MTATSGLTPDQARLLKRLLVEKGVALAASDGEIEIAAIPDMAARHEPFPLTDIQMAYWLGRFRQFELGGVASHGYQEYECGPLDLQRFREAWQSAIARHDMLRAVVGPDGMMRILPDVPVFEIPTEDLADLPEDQREARLLAIRATMSHKVPAPDCWPLLELRISRISPDCTRIHLSCDAIVADVYSMFICLAEVGQLYADPSAELPTLSFSFRDYVLKLKANESTSVFAASERYWLTRLDSLSAAPELPIVSTSPEGAPRFARRHLHLPATRWQSLKNLAKHLGLTPSVALLAAFAEVLRAWSRNPAFTLNLTLFNRAPVHPEIDRVMGDFTATLLLDLGACAAPDAPFHTRATRIQDQFWADYEHADFTGVRVLQHLSQKRRAAVAMPIVFTSAIGVGDVGQKLDTAGGMLGRPTYGITQTPQVQIDHQVFELDGGLGVNWDVVEGLFAPGVIEAMFAAYAALLERLADDPAAWNEVQPVALPAEQRAARAAANDTAADLGPDDLLHHPVLRQALATPDRIAVVAPDRALTYGELVGRALALSRNLAGFAEPDALVAIALPKGWPQVVAALATLIAGAAYVPIDPDLPKVRRDTLLAEAKPVALLSSADLIAQMATGLPAFAVEDAQPEPLPDTLPVPGQSPL